MVICTGELITTALLEEALVLEESDAFMLREVNGELWFLEAFLAFLSIFRECDSCLDFSSGDGCDC